MRERSGRFRLDVLLQREYDRFVYRFELRLQSAILDTASISPLTHHMQRVMVQAITDAVTRRRVASSSRYGVTVSTLQNMRRDAKRLLRTELRRSLVECVALIEKRKIAGLHVG